MSTHESGPVELDREARAAFLGNGGTGVLSFDTPGDQAPHSVPISYGFDETDETFYFRLSVGPDREKTPYVESAASFVVYDREGGDRWRSVLARGRLEAIDEAVGTEALAGLDHSHIPMFDVFGDSTETVTFDFYRLVPDELTGYVESAVRE